MGDRAGSSPVDRTKKNHNIDTKNIGIMAFLLIKWGYFALFHRLQLLLLSSTANSPAIICENMKKSVGKQEKKLKILFASRLMWNGVFIFLHFFQRCDTLHIVRLAEDLYERQR